MSKSSDVGKLNLEGLMSRAEILFTVGYQFRGKPDIHRLRHSYETITGAITKLFHQIDFRAQKRFQLALVQ